MGFAESREEVQEIIDAVDDDKSGKIEFGELLGIIKNSDSNDKSKIFEFFTNMTNGNFDIEEEDEP